MTVICLNCEAMGSAGCHLCRSERTAAKSGEQGLSPLEIEVDGLRAELVTVRLERDRALAELALLRVPGGQA